MAKYLTVLKSILALLEKKCEAMKIVITSILDFVALQSTYSIKDPERHTVLPRKHILYFYC